MNRGIEFSTSSFVSYSVRRAQVHFLSLQALKERFHERVVVAVTLGRHAWNDAVLLGDLLPDPPIPVVRELGLDPLDEIPKIGIRASFG